MKVAIMGAGLSGLACALSLEKRGIVPDIYESRSMVGDRFVTGEIFLSLTSRPIQDCVTYCSNELGIHLHPVNMIRTIHIYGPTEHAVIEGLLGHSNIRGRHELSTESQLNKDLKARIRYRSQATYEDLIRDYSHVIIATGETETAHRLNNYDTALTVAMKGTIVKGSFNLQTVYTWLNDEFCPKGYGYLIPLSTEEACMALAYPEYPEYEKLDIHRLWDAFKARVQQDLGQPLPIVDDGFEINHYAIGLCRNPRIGNTFFVGNNFGSVMPFLGFGQFSSIVTGAFAAHDICGLGDYEELTKPFRKSFENSLVLRRSIEQIGNEQLDTIVKWLDSPLGDRIFNAGKTDVLRLAKYLLRPWLRIKTLV
jgi:flavin-dependent dehydrogenase